MHFEHDDGRISVETKESLFKIDRATGDTWRFEAILKEDGTEDLIRRVGWMPVHNL